MPTFVISHNELALKIANGSILWVKDARLANSYTSKYQAKRHLKQLDNMPEGAKVIELVTVED